MPFLQKTFDHKFIAASIDSSYGFQHFLVYKNVHLIQARVARWHIFKPIISIWVNFGGSSSER
jgi:hypothetical protein